jgi:hypothetical protein
MLTRLAGCRRLWDRPTAILATFHYIKRGESHDLIHKAVG